MTTNYKSITLTDENFRKEVIECGEPVLVDLCAHWSGSSHIMATVINDLAIEFEGKIKVGRLDVDLNPQTGAAYAIRTIPTFLILNDGRVVDQVVGMGRKIELAENLCPVAILRHDGQRFKRRHKRWTLCRSPNLAEYYPLAGRSFPRLRPESRDYGAQARCEDGWLHQRRLMGSDCMILVCYIEQNCAALFGRCDPSREVLNGSIKTIK